MSAEAMSTQSELIPVEEGKTPERRRGAGVEAWETKREVRKQKEPAGSACGVSPGTSTVLPRADAITTGPFELPTRWRIR